MTETLKIENEWINSLFENENFTAKLKSFIKDSRSETDFTLVLKTESEIEQISEEISSLLNENLSKESEQRCNLISEEISKINNEISILKNYMFGYSEKQDLETTCYNKSKLEISSILEQDNGLDLGEVKAILSEIQQRMEFWFGKTEPEKQLNFGENSRFSNELDKKCKETFLFLEEKMRKQFESTDLVFERRIEQISKTLNNVLEMINENPNKSEPKNHLEKLPSKETTNNAQSLLRQSSLQNLKIKNFFTFGHR